MRFSDFTDPGSGPGSGDYIVGFAAGGGTNSDRKWLYTRFGRELLTTNRTYYVRTDGSDSNNGLTNSTGGAFLTLQKAINVALMLDLASFSVTIQVGAGTYTAGVNLSQSFIGGIVSLVGDTTTPSNVIISVTGTNCIQASGLGTQLNVAGFKLTAATSGSGIVASAGAQISVTGKMEYGSMGGGSNGFHIVAQQSSIILINADYTISGSAQGHWFPADNSILTCTSHTITLSGTPAFSISFLWCDRGSVADVYGNTFSGSATGARYTINGNSVGFVNGGGATYLPGGSAGSTANGGQYY